MGISFPDQIVLYRSAEDADRWVAHSLETDQIGVGDDLLEALTDVIQAVACVVHEARADETLAYLRKAPQEVCDLVAKAKRLPFEMFEIAHKRATGEFPPELRLQSDADHASCTYTVASFQKDLVCT